MKNKDFFPIASLDLIQHVTSMFEKVSVLWQKYLKNHVWKDAEYSDLAGEVGKRLSQLEYVFKRVVFLEEQSRVITNNMMNYVIKNNKTVPVIWLNNDSKIGFKIEFLTESFYYFAFRFITVLSSLTGDKKIKDESKGVLMVRNKLIEHPEGKDSRIFILSFAHIGPNGPSIKSARYPNQIDKWKDEGLYKNISQMLEVTLKSLSKQGL